METLPRPANSTIAYTLLLMHNEAKRKTKQIGKEEKLLSNKPDDFKVNKSKKSNGI